eukprot:1124854-Alexandrium_andersonii.AAC.1
MRNMQSFMRSSLEMRWPGNGLEIGTRSSQGVFFAFSRADAESADESRARGGPRSRNRKLTRSNPQSAICQPTNPRNPWLVAREKPGLA